MATILNFDVSRCRQPKASHQPGKADTGSAEILLFMGVRREQLLISDRAGAVAKRPEPMFDDPLPNKPGGRKARRQKKI